MPYVKWKKGTDDVRPQVTPPIGKNILQLTDIRETTVYTCVAASKWGVIESQTNVRVQTLPRPPETLRATEITATSVKLSWSYPGTGSEVQYYVIEYRPKRATWDWKEISGAITQFYDIRGLTPYTEYEFVVLGVNNVGRGEKSDPIVVTTGDTNNGTQGNPSKFRLPIFFGFRPFAPMNAYTLEQLLLWRITRWTFAPRYLPPGSFPILQIPYRINFPLGLDNFPTFTI